MKIIILSILAVAMIGLMVPSVSASSHSIETPDHIKEKFAKEHCLSKNAWNIEKFDVEYFVWEDGKCQATDAYFENLKNKLKSWGINQDLQSNKTYNIGSMNLNFMPKAETPEAIKKYINESGFEKAEERIKATYEYELSTMPVTENEYVALSTALQNKWNQMESECRQIYGDGSYFRDFDHQFEWNKCILNAQSWHEQQQNLLFNERCCVHESQKKELIDELERITNRAYAELEAEREAYEREQYPEEFEKLEQISAQESSQGGGCLIATAAYGSELAPQVQFLRELRDNTVSQTQSGTTFMTGFNQFYYSFSPAVADYERENPVFKEAVKLTLTPLLTSLTILNYVDIDTEQEMLGYGIGVILLNMGMYFVAPAAIIIQIKRWKNSN